MENFIIDKWGKKRKVIEKICKYCSNTFLTRDNKPNKYCSLKCGNKANQAELISVECAKCKKSFKKKCYTLLNSKSGLYFCNYECKNAAQRIGGIKEIQPPHYGTGKKNYRDNFTEKELYCRGCGYKKFPSCIEIHHIDYNNKNNKKENLLPLCCNCHQEHHRCNIDLSEIIEKYQKELLNKPD